MTRAYIEMPGHCDFKTSLPVRISDLNYGNHLGNDSLLSILHEARVRFLQSMGFSELDAGGCGIILSDVVIQYISEAFYGEVLEIAMAAGEFSRVGFALFYKVSSAGREVAIAKTGIVCFDYAVRKVVAVPGALRQKLGF